MVLNYFLRAVGARKIILRDLGATAVSRASAGAWPLTKQTSTNNHGPRRRCPPPQNARNWRTRLRTEVLMYLCHVLLHPSEGRARSPLPFSLSPSSFFIRGLNPSCLKSALNSLSRPQLHAADADQSYSRRAIIMRGVCAGCSLSPS